jgi:hypothetical protein
LPFSQINRRHSSPRLEAAQARSRDVTDAETRALRIAQGRSCCAAKRLAAMGGVESAIF